jgi:hypothetical protein
MANARFKTHRRRGKNSGMLIKIHNEREGTIQSIVTILRMESGSGGAFLKKIDLAC